MNEGANFAYQTPGQYRVFFMDQSSIVIDALSQYDAKKKTQATYPGKLVLRAQLICRTQTAYQTPIAIVSTSHPVIAPKGSIAPFGQSK
jgi:hypothetical protein